MLQAHAASARDKDTLANTVHHYICTQNNQTHRFRNDGVPSSHQK